MRTPGIRGSHGRTAVLFAVLISLPVLFLFPGCGGDDGAGPERIAPPPEEPAGYIGPNVTLTEPARSAMIQGGTADDSPVQVNGTACDDVHDLTAIRVDGQDIPAPASGECRNFGFQRSSRLGMTIIQGTATNTQGQVGSLAQAYLRSPEFFPPLVTRDEASRATSGLYMGIGQEFLDDSDRSDMDDMVSILNHALSQVDFDALIGNPKYASPDNNNDGEVDRHSYDCFLYTETNYYTGYRVRKTGPFVHSGVEVLKFEFIEGGIAIQVGLTNAGVSMDATGYLDLDCLGEQSLSVGGSAYVPGQAILSSTATIGVGADGSPELSFGSTTLVAASPVIDIDLGLLDFVDFLINPILNAASGMLNDIITDAGEGAIEGVLNDVLPDLLTQLAVNESIALPAPFSTTVNLSSAFDLASVGTDGMRLGAYTEVLPATPKPEHRGAPYGAIRYDGDVPAMSLDPNSFQVGVKDDLMNQFLWAVWLGGGLDVDDISDFVDPSELQGLDLKLFSTIPPVIMTGAGADAIDIGWGDIRVTVTVAEEEVVQMIADAGMEGEVFYARKAPLEIELYLSVIIGGQIQTNPETNRLDADMSTSVEVFLQVASVSDPEQVDPALISVVNSDVAVVLEDALPGLLENLLGSFPLPSINIGDISDIMPDIELWLSAAEIRRDGHYSVMAGDMSVR